MRYERVWVFGMYRKQPFVKGLQCRDLPPGTVIVADHFNGNLKFTDCARANLLFNTSFEGAIVVEGKEPQRDGLLGFMTRLATINTNGLFVKDSQNLVMSDYYVESADRMMEFRGKPATPWAASPFRCRKAIARRIRLSAYRTTMDTSPSAPACSTPAASARHESPSRARTRVISF